MSAPAGTGQDYLSNDTADDFVERGERGRFLWGFRSPRDKVHESSIGRGRYFHAKKNFLTAKERGEVQQQRTRERLDVAEGQMKKFNGPCGLYMENSGYIGPAKNSGYSLREADSVNQDHKAPFRFGWKKEAERVQGEVEKRPALSPRLPTPPCVPSTPGVWVSPGKDFARYHAKATLRVPPIHKPINISDPYQPRVKLVRKREPERELLPAVPTGANKRRGFLAF